jgi:multidrug efflux system outer membrane protein
MYEQAVVPAVPAGLPSALLERRPDLRQAEQTLVAANAGIGVAKAQFFPQLSLTALFGRASPEVSALTGGTSTIWAVAGMLSGPIFEGGRNLSNYRLSKAQWERARLQYEQAMLTALREVSDALTLLGKLRDAEVGQARAVRALEQAVEHAMDRYRYGFASYYEVLEAQQQLYPAQNTLAQIRHDRLLAYVQLYKVLGGGWSVPDPEWRGAVPAAPGPLS